MVSTEQRRKRRGSRREGAPSQSVEQSGGAQGFTERLLSFESFVGFQHESIGVVVGLAHAIDLLTRRAMAGVARRRKTAPHIPRRRHPGM